MNLLTDDSILGTIKTMLGLTSDVTAFDQELITHINSMFTILNQLDIGPDAGFMIYGYDEVWGDFVEDVTLTTMVREFIYLKVRMIFDPPASSVVSDAFNQRIAELEWRMNIQAERLAALAEKEGAAP